MPKRFQITVTEEALADLSKIKDRGVRGSVQAKVEELSTEPHERGKPLTDDLTGYYRVKVRRRYRVIYRVAMLEELVIVIVIGIP